MRRVDLARVRGRRLMWAVRRADAGAVREVVECEDPVALAVVLAAMVPYPLDPGSALAWTGDPWEEAVAADRERACALATAVRAWDYARVRHLCHGALAGTSVVLAAMADADAPDEELLGWVEPAYERRVRAPVDAARNRRRLVAALPPARNV